MKYTRLTTAWLLFVSASASADEPVPLPGTRPLMMEGDIASQLVDGVDRFLLRKIDESVAGRAQHWKRDASSPERYAESIEPNRKRLAQILGLRDQRLPFAGPERIGAWGRPGMLDRVNPYKIFVVRWPAFGDVNGEGLLLVPEGKGLGVDIVAIPDADQTPEQLAGLEGGIPPESQFARRLAESGCRVVVPVLVDRQMEPRGRVKVTNREFLYRSAYELGRHLIGYEVQKVLALVDWFATEAKGKEGRIGVVGWGDGGMLALYAGALDPRIGAVGVSGYFADRRDVWREPIDHNIFGLLDQFGDAELASMIAPRPLIIEAARGPEVVVPPGLGGGPGRLVTPELSILQAEVERARSLVAPLKPRIELVKSGTGTGPPWSEPALDAFLQTLTTGAGLAPPRPAPAPERDAADKAARHARQMHELDRHNQWLLSESPYVRQAFMARLDTSSLARFQETIEPYRTRFRDEVIGRFDDELLAPNPRSRKVFDESAFTGYEVVLDVYPEVIAYGILLVPKDLAEGEKRPVVVCQHGLEGRPQDVADPKVNNPAYNQFAIALAKRGFVTFAPQNLYIFQDRFRTLQRKANPLGKTLFSIIVPQHQQITDWLKALPFVDSARIAFYGLSYGGKSAMRIPPLVSNYCLSICSADFNEWVWKNASTRSPYSYVWTMEYEIFEFDLGSTFNYAEMAALIAPRPFMVERGHFDGVAPDETVAYEFAKIRFLYEAKLGLADRCELEWFVGPHTIHGVGTFDFLHKHLKWPKRQ
jgi:dienelactone hydrolase